MANILVFEDYYMTIGDIRQTLSGTPHEIVGEACSLNEAQYLIGKIASKEIRADVLLLDGNLDNRDEPLEFRYTFPLDGTEPIKRTLFGRVKSPKPREIVVCNYEQGSGAHARMIKKVLDACEISVPIIGISGDPMEINGVEVDVDIGKGSIIDGLIPAIEDLTKSSEV